jgi:hypothetical protein
LSPFADGVSGWGCRGRRVWRWAPLARAVCGWSQSSTSRTQPPAAT